MKHHNIDPYPIPKDMSPRYINEPSLIDKSLLEYSDLDKVDTEPDNVRIYIPMDLNKEAILRRLDYIIAQYEEASEANEYHFSIDVYQLVSQIEIYDRLWYVRNMPAHGQHSKEAIELAKEFVARLEEIPDACAERFPFELIDELAAEYLS